MADIGRPEYKDISGCSDLGKLFKDSLPDAFPMTFIRDSEVKPKAQQKSLARSSLPNSLFLMPSALGGGRLGVYTTNAIEGRAIFGPFKGKKITTPDVANEADYSSSWDVIKSESTQDQFTVDGSDEWTSNWMRFVNCARNENEQNLVSFQHCGDIYYRTCKPIDSGSELLVWFDDLFYSKNKSVGQTVYNTCSEEDRFACTNCKLVFLGPSYLYRHKQHRCPVQNDSEPPSIENALVEPVVPSSADNTERTLASSNNTQMNSDTSQTVEYQCSRCDKRFKTSKLLLYHFRDHTADFPYKCWVCGEGFKDLFSRIKHAEEHKKKFKCSDCKRSYNDKSALQKHQCRGFFVKPKKLKCNQCEKSFKRKDYLESHMSTHSETRQFSCDLCDKQYTKRAALSRHKRLHRSNDDQSSRCKICGKLFCDASTLKVHQRVHTGERPYKCRHCEKCFAQSSTLAGHLRTHEPHKNKPFKCNDCGTCFARVADFRIHQRIHTGEKPYKCDHCEKRFRWNSSLAKHSQIHLPEGQRIAKLWKCGYCDKTFTRNSNLRKHERTHTGEKPHKCADCNKRYSRKEDLKLHREVHTAEKHECWVCGKVFFSYDKMKLHICVHTGEKPHSCPVCEKGYISSRGFRKHLRSHTPSN